MVYDLPDRDCAAASSNGEYSIADGGVANYEAYINAIKVQIAQYPNTKVILVIGKSALWFSIVLIDLDKSRCSREML